MLRRRCAYAAHVLRHLMRIGCILGKKKQVHIICTPAFPIYYVCENFPEDYRYTIFFMAVMAARNSAPHTSME
jgi:hypothetical protein